MKLSELVELRNQFESLDLDLAENTATAHIKQALYLSRLGVREDLGQQLDADYDQLTKDFVKIKSTTQHIIDNLNQQINEQGSYWFQESYRLYDQEMTKFETTDYILNRRLVLPYDAQQAIKGRLRMHSDWKYPGMIIRPGLEDFIEELVCYDPLYLVDQSHDLLTPCMKNFNSLYQNRLRTYAIRESLSQPMLDKIPDGQFGVIFAYNFFNFKPFDLLKKYLTELHKKLRPGGVLLFTFNDGDRRRAVEEVENHFACYTPGKLVMQMAQAIGFTETFSWSHPNEASVIIELQREGQMESIRGGQTLAKIQTKLIDTAKKTQ